MFIGAIALLLLNDHVLKAAWPGLVTGKLSDIAGVAMIAILGAAFTGRATLSCAATALCFTALKTVPIVAVWAAPVLGGVTRTDPTDLVALIVLVPLSRWMSGPRRPQADRRAWIVAVQIVAVSTAVFATTATSCDPGGVHDVGRIGDGRLRAIGTGAVSDDGGRTWTTPANGLPSEVTEQTDSSSTSRFELQTTAGSGRRLVEQDGGVETEVFAADRAAIERLDRLDPPSCTEAPFGGVAEIDIDGETHAVVAMGWLGVIHVGPDLVAEWVAVGEHGVQAVDAPSRPLGLDVATPVGTHGFGFAVPIRGLIAMLVAAPLLPLLAIPIVAAMARRRHRDVDVAVGVCAASGVLLGCASAVIGLFVLTGAQGRTSTAVVTVVFALGLLASVPWVLWHRRAATSVPIVRPLYPPPPSNDRSATRPLPPPDPSERRD